MAQTQCIYLLSGIISQSAYLRESKLFTQRAILSKNKSLENTKSIQSVGGSCWQLCSLVVKILMLPCTRMSLQIHFVIGKRDAELGLVVQIYNPSYSRGRGRRIVVQGQCENS
jgi:hypothetical protein